MAATVEFVLAEDDERALFAALRPLGLVVYPERVPPGWEPFPADEKAPARMDGPSWYLAAEQLGPVVVRTIKRGPDRGSSEIDETASPVLHYERCVFDEKGLLRSGHLWTFLDTAGDVRPNPALPPAFRSVWLRAREHLVKHCHRSQPPGFLIGNGAARLHKAGTVLREAGHQGAVLKPWR